MRRNLEGYHDEEEDESKKRVKHVEKQQMNISDFFFVSRQASSSQTLKKTQD